MEFDYITMPALEKIEGKKTVCPICNDPMVCVNKPFGGKDKLQWQNPNGTAHYNYDFKTQVTTCNRVGEQAEKTESKPSAETKSEPKTVSKGNSDILDFIKNYEFKELKTDVQQEAVINKARKIFEEKLLVTKVAIEEFSAVGFDNVASIGQVEGILNQ